LPELRTPEVRIPDGTPLRISPGEAPLRVPTSPPKDEPPMRLPGLPQGRELKELKLIASYPNGTVAWKQGAVYAVWRPPYEPDERLLTYQVEKPVGVPIFRGPESAARSLTQIEPGKLPRVIDANLGFARIQLNNGRALSFTRRSAFPRKKVRF